MIAAFIAISTLPTGAPGYAHVLGITLGLSTQAELERKIGKGEVSVGGHSNSRREWRFQSCTVASDGFEFEGYKRRYPTIDWLAVDLVEGRLGVSRPFSKFGSSWLGDLTAGESVETCLRALAKWNLHPQQVNGSLELKERRIVELLGSKDRVLEYKIDWVFEKGGLQSVDMNATVVMRD